MTDPKLPSKKELDIISKALGADEWPLAVLIAGCREALRLQEERRKLAEAWVRHEGHAAHTTRDRVKWGLGSGHPLCAILNALAAECGKETE